MFLWHYGGLKSGLNAIAEEYDNDLIERTGKLLRNNTGETR